MSPTVYTHDVHTILSTAYMSSTPYDTESTLPRHIQIVSTAYNTEIPDSPHHIQFMRWTPKYMVWTPSSICCGQHEMYMVWRICCGQHRMYMVWTTMMLSTAYNLRYPQYKKRYPRYITHSINGYAVDYVQWIYTVDYPHI